MATSKPKKEKKLTQVKGVDNKKIFDENGKLKLPSAPKPAPAPKPKAEKKTKKAPVKKTEAEKPIVINFDDLKNQIKDIKFTDTENTFGLHRVKRSDGLTLFLARQARYGIRFYLLNDKPSSMFQIKSQEDLKRASALIHAVDSQIFKEGKSYIVKDGKTNISDKNEMVLHFTSM